MQEQLPADAQESPEQQHLFNDAFDMEPYRRNMKNAQIWLYVVAGIQLIMGIIEYSRTDDTTIAWIAFGIDAFISLIFLALALWSKKAPVTAFTIALVFYLVFNIGFMVLDPTNIARGIIIKILVVVALVKATRDAKKYVAIKNSVGEEV
jgi:predicted MFS family arabinose efflux permease